LGFTTLGPQGNTAFDRELSVHPVLSADVWPRRCRIEPETQCIFVAETRRVAERQNGAQCIERGGVAQRVIRSTYDWGVANLNGKPVQSCDGK